MPRWLFKNDKMVEIIAAQKRNQDRYNKKITEASDIFIILLKKDTVMPIPALDSVRIDLSKFSEFDR